MNHFETGMLRSGICPVVFFCYIAFMNENVRYFSPVSVYCLHISGVFEVFDVFYTTLAPVHLPCTGFFS